MELYSIMGVFNLHKSEFVTNRQKFDCKNVYLYQRGEIRWFENGSIQFGFGNGASERSNYGFAMITPGKVVGYSICSTSNNTLVGAIQINLMINGVENSDYKISKPSLRHRWS